MFDIVNMSRLVSIAIAIIMIIMLNGYGREEKIGDEIGINTKLPRFFSTSAYTQSSIHWIVWYLTHPERK